MREAQHLWRQNSSLEDDWGAGGRYTESGVVYVADKGARGDGEKYLQSALQNVRKLAEDDPGIGGRNGQEGIKELHSTGEIEDVMGKGALGAGTWGYLNEGSGWANAEKCVDFAVKKLEQEGLPRGRLTILTGQKVKRLIYSDYGKSVKGALLESGDAIEADLTILATGCWTPALVDLRGRAVATGQALGYVDITEEEQSILGDLPVILNENDGTFIIPPRDRLLKIARHGYGYRNPIKIPNPMPGKEGEQIEVSVPVVGEEVPSEGQEVCRQALKNMVHLKPGPADREWAKTRVCWYCDTPSGDFLITPHPAVSNLILATGGSGHGFKFLPVIGEKIVDLISDHLGLSVNTFDPELKHIWRWRNDDELLGKGDMEIECEDGSRGGKRGMIWANEVE
ncbi:putative fructosyl amino acid oxidasesarcosine oxidase [Phaeomoniella chlamydospora]|uniref:Putative fructosyl amino acid oxidasesarcosine oxidase n=1 Tax=Phaeomoniella chlamydospora TaxID=158046 RepID=A0A0G2F2V4_PHACM|nr:putative fructosyl amino acid oxidasesarcosine oxidase [Phaeomoniella chlamydospora]